MRRAFPPVAVLALLAGLSLLGCREQEVGSVAAPATGTRVAAPGAAARHVTRTHPVPTEIARDEERIEREHEARREWIDSMHRAAPGTDWKAIERENGERLMQRRIELRARKAFVPDTWTERGSSNMAGRMHCATLGLDGTTLYAGSSHGGTWRGATDGSSWTPIGDNLFGGTHHICVGAAPQETVLAMHGGGRLRYSQDQGVTWLTPTGLPGDINGGKNIFSDPSDRSRVYALFRRPSGMEVFRSDDGGLSWLSINPLGTSAADMWIDRVSGGTLYVLAGADMWSTADGGGRWRQESTLAPGPYDGAVLAGSEAGAPTFYAALHVPNGAWELRRSDDGARSWQRLADLGDFWEVLEASISDPMIVAKGGLEMFRSTDAAANWTLASPWWAYYGSPSNTLHADHMGMDVVMLGGQETWFIATDGGHFRSDDRGATVANIALQGLRVSQYYSTHTSILDPTRVIAGAQDQGYQRSTGPGTPLFPFDQLISGDYAHLTSGDRTHAWVYSTYPGFILVHQGELSPALSQLDFPTGSQQQWLPGVLADPTNREAFYFFADHLWRYERAPNGTWSYFQESTQDFAPDGTVTALSISRVDPQQRVLACANGALWRSIDSGFTWTRSTDPGPGAHYFSGTALEHSPDDPLTAVVAGAGYSGPAAYRTVDGGITWQPIGGGLPQTLVYDIAWQGPGSSVVFAATEAGPYRLDPATDTWEYIGGLIAPLTTYWSVESIPENGTLRFGTYGRGIWDWQAAVIAETGHCADGADNEGDGLIDCADDECGTADEDGDQHLDCGADCAVGNGGTWSAPGEIASLRVSKPAAGSTTGRLTWTDDQLVAAGSGGVTDVVSGDVYDLRASRWPAWAPCLAEDQVGVSMDDPAGVIAATFYLVRAQNSCGIGPWGIGDAGPAVPLPDCR